MVRKKLIESLATFFYIGRIPLMPGTSASFVGMLIAFSLADHIFLYISVFAVITVLGFYSSGYLEDILGEKDPGCIVIDEVSGVMISFFLLPISFPIAIITFFIFRAFDMFKVYPVGKFEKMEGGIGIMMDDIVAGIYTNVTMHAALYLVNFFT